MKEMREVIISAWTGHDVEVGDAVRFQYLNELIVPDPLGPHVAYAATSGNAFRYVHGAIVHGGKAGELVSVRLALAGTLGVKVTWTGDLVPGQKLYPPNEQSNAVSATPQDVLTNVLGIYAGRDTLSDANSGQVCEVLITRVSPHYDE